MSEINTKSKNVRIRSDSLFENIPIMMSQKPVAIPALREAHLVIAITPLFCENVVFGMLVNSDASIEQMASAIRLPWIRR